MIEIYSKDVVSDPRGTLLNCAIIMELIVLITTWTCVKRKYTKLNLEHDDLLNGLMNN